MECWIPFEYIQKVRIYIGILRDLEWAERKIYLANIFYLDDVWDINYDLFLGND